MSAMESLRQALTPFPALVASAPPSRIDRQLREVATALADLLSPQETDLLLQQHHAEQEQAVQVLLDTFCKAHAEDHMSDLMKLGSWRLPYVAMLHKHTSLHLPLIRQLEVLLHSGGSLGPVQCTALCTFMLFMSPFQLLPKAQVSGAQVYGHSKAAGNDMQIDEKEIAEERSKGKENCQIQVLFEWRWETCFRVQSVQEHSHRDGHKETSQVEDESLDMYSIEGHVGNHWMEAFCDAFLLDSETNILWATRFAASYLRNVAVYWKHVLFKKDYGERWLLTDLAQQLKSITLVGPIFVAFIPQNLVLLLLWLHQRLAFAFHFSQPEETASLKKVLVLCETVLASPLGVLLRSTKPSLCLRKIVQLESKTGWREWILSKSCHLYLRSVVWGGAVNTGASEYCCSWGLLWKDYGGDRARACIDLTAAYLCERSLKSRFPEEQLPITRVHDDKESSKRSWSGTKKQSFLADPSDFQNLPQVLWFKESETSPAEVFILQILVQLSSNLDLQRGQWFLEAASGSIEKQLRLESALLTHNETCLYARKCKSRQYSSGVCSAHRLKSCITALSPSHSISYERLHKMENIFRFCWLKDGPFSIDFAAHFLLDLQSTQPSDTFLKEENQWSTFLLATWVRFFNVVGAPILNLHHMVGDVDLGSMLKNLHTTLQYLCSDEDYSSLDVSGFRVAAKITPQLVAVFLIESLFTSYTPFSATDRFLVNLATEASQQQHAVADTVLALLKMVTTHAPPESRMEKGAPFFKLLLFNLVDLLSMAAKSSPDLILQKWTAFEYKRKWVTPKSSTLLSLASIELELDEQSGEPPKGRVWDILLEWVINLITLRPDLISELLNAHHGDIDVGFKALALVLVVAGLHKNTVLSLLKSDSTSWALLLSHIRTGLEDGFRQLWLGDRKAVSFDISGIRADMDSYLLQLQNIV